MDLYDAIRNRRSVRCYKTDPVPEESLDRILEAARCAPSSLNLQPWKFILVSEQHLRNLIVAHCPGQDFASDAPVLLVACALPTEGTIGDKVPSNIADVSTAFAHLALAATAEGLGTCWLSNFDEAPVKKALDIPDSVAIVAISPIGFPADSTVRPKHRKSINEIVSWDKFD